MTAQQSDDKEGLPGMLAVAKGVAEQTFPHTMDAQVWAKEFIKANPCVELDEGDMIGWFANAIMAGYDTARSRTPLPECGTLPSAKMQHIQFEGRDCIVMAPEDYDQLERELNDLARQLAAARPSDKSVLLAKMLELGGIQRPEDYLTMAREILRLAEGKP